MRSLIFVFIFVLMISVVHASDVAYIVNTPGQEVDHIIDLFNQVGLSVDVIDNADVTTTDFSTYEFMFIPDLTFQNSEVFPVNQVPALIMNTKHIDEWEWTSRISSKSSSQLVTAHPNNSTHFITDGFENDFPVYNTSSQAMTYLHRFYRALDLMPIVSTDNASVSNTLNGVVLTAVPGTQLKNGAVSNTSSVFFGPTRYQHWTPEMTQIFRNSARWLTVDFEPPQIANLTEENLTNSSIDISWNTDKVANYTFSYGTTTAVENEIKTTALETVHAVPLTDLSEKTQYFYKVSVCNEDNVCSETGINTFTTLDLTAPYLESNTIVNVTNSTAEIFVELTEAGTAQLHYGSTAFDMQTPLSAVGDNASFILADLTDKTDYSYFVEMCDAAANCRNSTIFDFTTPDITNPDTPKNLAIAVQNPGNDILLSWDAATDDTAHYNLYFASTPEGFNFSVTDATTTNAFYLDTDNVDQRFYVVRAEDGHGNEEPNENILGKYNIDLNLGYNLVSFPITPVDLDISAVMHQNISYQPVTEVKKYDAVAQEFVTSSFDGTNWNVSFDLEPGYGYFFNSDAVTDFTIVGEPTESVDLAMKTGMNLFGLVSLDEHLLSTVIPQNPADINVTEVGARTEIGTYNLTQYTTDWSEDFTLLPGTGYWAQSTQDFTLTLTK